jgi:tRNA(Ile)-lysidine synthetase-like protein
MESEKKPYLVAVSGGIDSMVLLDMLVQQGQPLVVAHVDHGIRSDGDKDRALVSEYADKYELPFVTTSLLLGPDTSELEARSARYAWLQEQQTKLHAGPIVTAHHRDDLIETIIINIMRGTGWRGLCSLRSTDEIVRPLLAIGMQKTDIVRYAIEHGLSWREDSTNDDVRYLRNHIRHGIIGKLPPATISQLVELYESQTKLRHEIDEELRQLVDAGAVLPRYEVIMMGDDVAEEIIPRWIGYPLQRPTTRRILHFAKTARPGTRFSLDGTQWIEASARELIVSPAQD